MEINGTYTFDGPIDAVWALLMDTSAIAGCVPGCRELRALGDDRFRAELSVPVAAVTGQFDATISLEGKIPPRAYTLNVQATGRPGFVRGQAVVTLAPEQERTEVHVLTVADVGGAIARVGQRLLEGAGRMMMDRFFECLKKKLADTQGS
jgi:carbon monoxide dehydrogenase subunit G